MKRCVRVLGFLAFTLAACASNLTPMEAAKHVGENATVCGVVASVHTVSSSKGSPTFVNLDKPYPNQIFTVLIWGMTEASLSLRQRVGKGSKYV